MLPDVALVLVLPPSQQDFWRQLCVRHHFTLPHTVASGGATRFHSVLNGLRTIPTDVAEAVVGVHDGVRPFVSPDVIRRCYAEAEQTGTAVPVMPVVETVRHIQADGTSSATIDRSRLRLVQTPQAFSLSLLRRAYEQPYRDAFTDDASVVEALGHPITLVEGNRENIKLTTPFDLQVAETILTFSREH